MSTLTVQIDKMGGIKIVNLSQETIHVSVTTNGDGGHDDWYIVNADGGSDTWNRNKNQVVRFTRSLDPGAPVESVLGVPDGVVNIHEPEKLITTA